MTIHEIFNELSQHLGEMEPRMKELQKMVTEYKEKLNSAETELADLKDKYESIRMSKEALELLDGVSKVNPDIPKEVKPEPENKEDVGEKKAKAGKKTPLKWTTKNARLIKMDRNGNVIGNYPSQKAAARDMGWDQSSLSRFLKLDHTTQVNKKNFYFRWEY